MKCCRTLGLCLLLATTAHGQSDTEPVPIPQDRPQTADVPFPKVGDRTSDGFLVKCYWIGTFKQVEKLEGQGVIDLFGQALSPVCGKSTTTASLIISEEADDRGNLRAVIRDGTWSSNFTGLHYWFKNGKRVAAGPGGSGGGQIPTSGEGAPSVSITYGKNTAGISLGWTESEPLAFDSKHLPLKLVTGGPSPLGVGPAGRQHVELDTKEKTERRKAHIMGMMATDEPVQAGRNTIIRQEWGDPGSDWYAQWTMTRACEYGKVKLITPRGNPRTAPRAAGDGQNEFTFDSASPGKLTINFKASVTPSSAINSARDRVLFTCEGIGGSTFAWDTNNPNGKATISGGSLVAKGTFTGLPQKNDDFGKKRVQLLLEGQEVEATNIEVFFSRDATNHAGGQVGSPNFFHYYLQTVPKLGPKPNIEYSTVLTSAYYPSRNKIYLDKITIRPRGVPYGTRGTLSGIDAFAWAATHEMQHYKDWADAWDVDNSGTAKKRAAVGKSGPADDRDDESIPNQVEDKNLSSSYDAGDLYDWTNPKTPTARRPANIINDFEDWNCQRNRAVTGNHAKDWSDPGMQHLTLDKWDD
jgi:hypothetical protein